MTNHVNYNNISPVYNERYKVSSLEGVEQKLLSIAENCQPQKILEVGCGTCHWLNLLSKFSSELYGADYSTGMLNIAKNSKTYLNLVNADANKLPFHRNSFDLIICINAIHHFSNKKLFIDNVSSLLKPNGILSIMGFDPYDRENDWYLYDYFERTHQLDLERFPTFNELEKWTSENGFGKIKTELIHIVKNNKTGRDVLQDHFLDKRGASQLALLSDEEYQSGLEKIKEDILKAEQLNEEIVFHVKLNFYALTAQKCSKS
ncbi:MAG: methyltransferase domain-containing protein [Ignavibacteriales bacterium]|nr:methyltransferase domain-containing protein [Ignavibacteriales bacterium]